MVVSLPWHVGMRSSLKIISAAGYPSASEIILATELGTLYRSHLLQDLFKESVNSFES